MSNTPLNFSNSFDNIIRRRNVEHTFDKVSKFERKKEEMIHFMWYNEIRSNNVKSISMSSLLLQDVTRCFISVPFYKWKISRLKSFFKNHYFCTWSKCVLSTERVNIEEKLKVNYISFRKVNDVSCCFYWTELLMKFYF